MRGPDSFMVFGLINKIFSPSITPSQDRHDDATNGAVIAADDFIRHHEPNIVTLPGMLWARIAKSCDNQHGSRLAGAGHQNRLILAVVSAIVRPLGVADARRRLPRECLRLLRPPRFPRLFDQDCRCGNSGDGEVAVEITNSTPPAATLLA